MSTKRPRNFDFSKPITRYSNIDDFLCLKLQDTHSLDTVKEDKSVINTGRPEIKQKIEIPETIKVEKLTLYQGISEAEKKRKHSLGYIRIKKKENIPLLDTYELTDKDYEFFKEYKLVPENGKISRESFLQKATNIISFYDQKSGRGQQLLTWPQMQEKLNEQTYYDFSDIPLFQMQEFYSYWETQRKLFDRPLLRQFQYANLEDTNPHAAFRPRGSEKMKLRGKNKQSDVEILNKFRNLKEEFLQHDVLFKCIRAREHLKFEQCVQQQNQFMEDLFSIDSKAEFKYMGQYQVNDMEEYLKQKQQFASDFIHEKDKNRFLKQAQDDAKKILHKIKMSKMPIDNKAERMRAEKELQLAEKEAKERELREQKELKERQKEEKRLEKEVQIFNQKMQKEKEREQKLLQNTINKENNSLINGKDREKKKNWIKKTSKNGSNGGGDSTTTIINGANISGKNKLIASNENGYVKLQNINGQEILGQTDPNIKPTKKSKKAEKAEKNNNNIKIDEFVFRFDKEDILNFDKTDQSTKDQQQQIQQQQQQLQLQIQQQQLLEQQELPQDMNKFDLASLMSALIIESKLTPADLANIEALNEKKHPQLKKQKEKEMRKQQQLAQKREKQLLAQKAQEEKEAQAALEAEKLHQAQILAQQQSQRKQLIQQQENQIHEIVVKEIARDPICEYWQQKQAQKDVLKNRKNTLTYNVYKKQMRGGIVQLYRSFDNMWNKQNFAREHEDFNYNMENNMQFPHKKVKTEKDIIQQNVKQIWHDTEHGLQKYQKFAQHILFEEQLEEDCEAISLGHVQDDLFKGIKKNLKGAFQDFQKNKNNNINNNSNIVAQQQQQQSQQQQQQQQQQQIQQQQLQQPQQNPQIVQQQC